MKLSLLYRQEEGASEQKMMASAYRSLCFLSVVCTLRAVNAQLPELVERLVDTTASVGSTASFDCEVRYLNSYSVIWLKSTPRLVYISRNGVVFNPADTSKYSILTDEDESSFTLQISNLVLADSGEYECRYETSVGTYPLGSVELTVSEPMARPVCQYVMVPTNTGLTVDLNCSLALGETSDATATITMNGVNVTPDYSLGESVVSRQTLDAIIQLDNFACSWESSTTGMTETCSFGEVAAAGMILGVTPFTNDVTVGQTARFSCEAIARSAGDEIVSFAWSLFKDGNQVNLGEREKGFMKQNMRILDVEMSDDNLLVVCTARSLLGLMVQGAATLQVHLLTSSKETVTTQMMTIRDDTITASPQDQAVLNTIIISVIATLLFVIVMLFIVIVFLAKSKPNRSFCFSFGRAKGKPHYRPSAARLTESDCQPYDQAIFLDENPDIIRGHSSSIPMYAVPDKLNKASTLDGGARYPPRHYVPRRETYGGSGASESEFWRQATTRIPDQDPNTYENIDSDNFKGNRQFRTKSHTVSQFGRAPNDTSPAPTARTYKGMKSASSLSTLYTKPEKPPRKISLRNRKSWDMPGSIENLCNSAVADRHSVKSLTMSLCEGDSYACIVDDDNVNVEDNTTMSEYMDMRSIPDVSMDQYMNDITGESELSPVDDTPVYAQVKK